MKKTSYYVGFKDKGLGKTLFLGPAGGFYSDFQSANTYTQLESTKALPELKKKYKEKRLDIVKITIHIKKKKA